MPYNPGVANRSGELIAQGIERGKQNAMSVLMWALDRSSKTKEMKSVAKTAFPDRAADINKMNLEGVAGFLQGQKVLSDQRTSALQGALTGQQLQLGQQRLAAGQREEGAQNAMGAAMQQAAPALQQSDFSVLPPGTGMESVIRGNVTTQGAPSSSALVAAMMRNPQSVNTPAGQAVLGDWMRTQSQVQRGAPEAASVGGIPTIYNRFTGQFEVDPRYKYQAIRDMKVTAAQPAPGSGPLMSPDKKFYWDGKTWKAVPAKKGPGLFDTGTDTAAGPDGGGKDPLGLFGN